MGEAEARLSKLRRLAEVKEQLLRAEQDAEHPGLWYVKREGVRAVLGDDPERWSDVEKRLAEEYGLLVTTTV